MKKVLLAVLLAVGFGVAHADVTGNLGLTSDYRFRGISQSQNAPAVQGGIDYSHSSGLYVGNWNSSISWINDEYGTSDLPITRYNVTAPVEMDFYFGFKREIIGDGFASDAGIFFS